MRAPFRLLSVRAPRQAVLRPSSRLAPSLLHEALRPPEKRTRDASDRCLPPKRTACTRTSCVPDSLTPLERRGRPTESKAPYGMIGGPDVSRRPRPLRRIATTTGPMLLALRLTKTRTWALSSHGADHDRASGTPVATSRWSSPPPSFLGAGTWPPLHACVGWCGSEDREIAKTTTIAVS